MPEQAGFESVCNIDGDIIASEEAGLSVVCYGSQDNRESSMS